MEYSVDSVSSCSNYRFKLFDSEMQLVSCHASRVDACCALYVAGIRVPLMIG